MLGDRRSLEPLADLIAADDVRMRGRAAAILGGLTGVSFDADYFDPEGAKEASASWRAWVAEHGRAAKLHLPLVLKPLVANQVVYCSGRTGEVVVRAKGGKELLRLKVGGMPWALDLLSNGHVLVGLYRSREIREYDPEGKLAWKVGKLPGGPMGVERLANGNTLAALSDSGLVVEINPAGKIVWQVTVGGRPADAVRLDNGRTLVAAHRARRVVEVDRAGKVVWELADLADPQRAQRLANGRTLVVHSQGHMVAEYDRGGRRVWQMEGLELPLDASRLPGGNLLVVFDGKKVVRRWDDPTDGKPSRARTR
jgi:outer membrane protein assembly factor BamB